MRPAGAGAARQTRLYELDRARLFRVRAMLASAQSIAPASSCEPPTHGYQKSASSGALALDHASFEHLLRIGARPRQLRAAAHRRSTTPASEMFPECSISRLST